MTASYDPNFPPNLDISPLVIASSSRQRFGHAARAAHDAQQDGDEWGQGDAIGQYGIAGRVWEATTAMTTYLTPPSSSLTESLTPTYDPPCPIFAHIPHQPSAAHTTRKRKKQRRIIELGSGQSVASLHLAQYLDQGDELVLTDLPEVVPLCRRNIERYQIPRRGEGRIPTSTGDEETGHGAEREQGVPNGDRGVDNGVETATGGVMMQGEEADGPVLKAAPLPWGGNLEELPAWDGQATHILLCDLIYFPQLYPPLLKTLLELTEPLHSDSNADGPIATVVEGRDREGEMEEDEDEDDEVCGPILIMSYKPRTLENEQPFFDAISLYFRTTPVVSVPHSELLPQPDIDNDPHGNNDALHDKHNSTPLNRNPGEGVHHAEKEDEQEKAARSDGNEAQTEPNDETELDADADSFAPKLFIYQRWRTTPEWRIPDIDDIMSGRGVRGVQRGRDFGYTEQMFAALEWD